MNRSCCAVLQNRHAVQNDQSIQFFVAHITKKRNVSNNKILNCREKWNQSAQGRREENDENENRHTHTYTLLMRKKMKLFFVFFCWCQNMLY